MSKRLSICQYGEVTDTYATLPAGLSVGDQREEGGKIYVLTQADDAVTAGQAVKLDAAADATGGKVTPTAAAGDSGYGIAETAIADESYGWVTIAGVVSVLVANNVAVDDPLAASSAAGVLDAAVEAGSGDYEFVAASALEANSSGSAAAKSALLQLGLR